MSERAGFFAEDDPLVHYDHRVVLQGVSWSLYEATMKTRTDSGLPRICYVDGTLELMTPSFDHEDLGFTLARLLLTYADEAQLDVNGFGSWTLKQRGRRAGLEPDQCFVVGASRRRIPDLAIEVIWTAGGLDKLEIYARLGVREVWVWRDRRLTAFVLGRKGYARRTTSAVLPELDLELLASFVPALNQSRAARLYRAALRRARKRRS